MSDYLTEQEQVQQLKNWIKQYGPTVLAGVALALALTTGWHYWQNYQTKTLTQASMIYDEMLAYRVHDNDAKTQLGANQLISNYPKTPYASLAAMMLARLAVTKNNNAEALTRLTWVIDHSKDPYLRDLARVRIARLQINNNKPQDALNILNTIEGTRAPGLIEEVRGDAYLAMKNLTAARNAYRKALDNTHKAESNRPLLLMKFDNLTAS